MFSLLILFYTVEKYFPHRACIFVDLKRALLTTDNYRQLQCERMCRNVVGFDVSYTPNSK